VPLRTYTLTHTTLDPVNTGMGDHVQGSTPGAGKSVSQSITSHPGQLNLAIPPWVGAVSTSNGYGDH